MKKKFAVQHMRVVVLCLMPAVVVLGVNSIARADGTTIELADGRIVLQAPAKWESKEPKYKSIVNYEFAVKAVDGDRRDGRVTVGGAGGGVSANLDRWKAQFVLAEGASPSQKKLKIAGQTVHYLDISGTYRPPPFLGEAPQADFRMLGAIIETESLGSYYVRFYGPERTVEMNEKEFMSVVESLKIKK